MPVKTKPHLDVVASGDPDAFAAELGAAIIVRWIPEREGDSSIPGGTHIVCYPHLVTTELIVGVAELWFEGGRLPTIEIGTTNEIPWRAILAPVWRSDDGEYIVRYKIEDR